MTIYFYFVIYNKNMCVIKNSIQCFYDALCIKYPCLNITSYRTEVRIRTQLFPKPKVEDMEIW